MYTSFFRMKNNRKIELKSKHIEFYTEEELKNMNKISEYSRQKINIIVKFKTYKRQITMKTMSPICRQTKNINE